MLSKELSPTFLALLLILKLMLQLIRTLLFFKLLKEEFKDILLLPDILLKQETEIFLDLLPLRNLKLINGFHGPTVNLSHVLELLSKLFSELLIPPKLNTLMLQLHLRLALKL